MYILDVSQVYSPHWKIYMLQYPSPCLNVFLKHLFYCKSYLVCPGTSELLKASFFFLFHHVVPVISLLSFVSILCLSLFFGPNGFLSTNILLFFRFFFFRKSESQPSLLHIFKLSSFLVRSRIVSHKSSCSFSIRPQ